MPAPSHQTMKLSRGRHRSPDEGGCVMELASMLAGEPFSDHCRRVCPTLGAFLRGYNDNIDDHRRRDLMRYASEAIGTRGGERLAADRADRCLAFARAAHRARRWRLPWGPRFPHGERIVNCEVAGRLAAQAALDDDAWHGRTLAFLDSLIELGGLGQPPPLTTGLPRDGHSSPEAPPAAIEFS